MPAVFLLHNTKDQILAILAFNAIEHPVGCYCAQKVVGWRVCWHQLSLGVKNAWKSDQFLWVIAFNGRHANIPTFGGILLLFMPFPTIPSGIHEIPLLQMLGNIINQTTIQLGIYHLRLNMRHEQASAIAWWRTIPE
jgi:hypothetical protein